MLRLALPQLVACSFFLCMQLLLGLVLCLCSLALGLRQLGRVLRLALP